MMIHYEDGLELAAYMIARRTGESIDELIEDETSIADKFEDTFGRDLDVIIDAAEMLLPFTPLVKSELTGEYFHAFGIHHENFFEAIVKQKVKE